MSHRIVVDGCELHGTARALDARDRGLAYGDGLFETMRLINGSIRFLERHLARLSAGCERLGIAAPDRALIEQDLTLIASGAREGVVKLIVTRGTGGRGYQPPRQQAPTRLLFFDGVPDDTPGQAITLRWCRMQLARNPVLAGIKHLNRLEQVLARAEWRDPAIDEGLMLDTEGCVVCGTSSNLFLVTGGTLVTPDLEHCGVHGVMRSAVLSTAQTASIECVERAISRGEVEGARELFVTNAVRGIRPVARLNGRLLETGPVTRELARRLELW